MHLSTEEPVASWMFELFGEVGGDVPEYCLLDKFFDKWRIKKLLRKLVLKT